MFSLWTVSITAPLLSWLAPPEARSLGATELRNQSATSLMDGCPKEKDLPEFEKTTEPTVAPHRMESSLAFLNRPWRRLEKQTLRAPSFSMRLISIFLLGMAALPFTMVKTPIFGFLLSLRVYADGDSMQDWYRSVYIGTYIGSKWKLRSAKI